MKRKSKISQREKMRRNEQRHAQWEKDNPNEFAAIKMLCHHPEDRARARIEMYSPFSRGM